ncbi:FtsX-like permease family protein [Clostridium botulinum]|uniref:FtsX-like permease family protein n=1 Tax=Clostridium botulinum TaxID=1491 RepID=UPI003DA682BE
MNLTRFAFNNVIRNKKAYFAYFLSSSISAALFFCFTTFIMHPNLKGQDFPADIKSVLITTELIAYVFFVLFVFYSVSVFLKNRNKEFGTLFILGTSKRQLSRLIFIENIIIIGLAAVVGIVFGMSFLKFFLLAISVFLSVYGIDFYFPKEAILITMGSFLLLGIVISFLVAFTVRENQVLKLLKGNRIPKKEPKTSLIFTIMALVLLVGAYYTAATAKVNNLGNLVMPVTITTIIATYFIFSQFNIFVLRWLKNNRIIYMKKINLIWISNLFYRSKDNVRMFFIITITSAVAFTSIGTFSAYMKSEEEMTMQANPQAIAYISRWDNNDNHEGTGDNKDVLKEKSAKNNYKDIESEKRQNQKNIEFIEESLKNAGIKYTKFTGDRKMVIDSVNKDYTLTLMPESRYNLLAASLKLNTINLKANEAFKVAKDKRAYVIQDLRSYFTINGITFNVIGNGKKNVLSGSYADAYVIKDEIFNNIENYIYKEDYYAFYVENWYSTLDVAKKIYAQFNRDTEYKNYYILSSAISFDTNRKNNSLNLLIVLFIGMLFFFTTGSFLYNKFYMDVNEDKKKFRDMNKIGVSYDDIKKVITMELGAMFLIPYIVAIAHSSFALSALKNAKNIDVTLSAFLVMGSFFLMQIVYFIVIRAMYLKEIKRELI